MSLVLCEHAFMHSLDVAKPLPYTLSFWAHETVPA